MVLHIIYAKAKSASRFFFSPFLLVQNALSPSCLAQFCSCHPICLVFCRLVLSAFTRRVGRIGMAT